MAAPDDCRAPGTAPGASTTFVSKNDQFIAPFPAPPESLHVDTPRPRLSSQAWVGRCAASSRRPASAAKRSAATVTNHTRGPTNHGAYHRGWFERINADVATGTVALKRMRPAAARMQISNHLRNVGDDVIIAVIRWRCLRRELSRRALVRCYRSSRTRSRRARSRTQIVQALQATVGAPVATGGTPCDIRG
jgi:hypothetical protein